MTAYYALAGFTAAVAPLVVTPGASLTLLIQRVTSAGRGQALPVILGTATALYLHAALALAGLSALVMRSSQAFAMVKLAGAVYLVGLGCWIWYTSRRPGPKEAGADPGARRAGPGRAGWRQRSGYLQALFGTVLNPKAALIYLTLLPQFLDPASPLAPQFLALTTLHAGLVAGWLLLWTVLLARAARFANRWRRTIARVSAAMLIALGVRTAVTA